MQNLCLCLYVLLPEGFTCLPTEFLEEASSSVLEEPLPRSEKKM